MTLKETFWILPTVLTVRQQTASKIHTQKNPSIGFKWNVHKSLGLKSNAKWISMFDIRLTAGQKYI